MMSRLVLVVSCGLVLAMVLSAGGYLVTIDNLLRDGQDITPIEGVVHELGVRMPFPADEEIVVSEDFTGYRPCPENPDETGIPNVLLRITNMTNIYWQDLHYVADPETTFQNYDKNRLNGMLAFRIDNVGVNTPLRSESMTPDLIFEPGETWEFVIQDYVNVLQLPASAIDSLGVPSQSPPSSGSIIAVPEPTTMVLLVLGGWMWRKRR